MKHFLILVLFIIGFLFEGFITTIPLTLMLLLVCYILYKQKWLFFAAILLGIGLDFLYMRIIGLSSIFLVLFLLLVRAYKQKFEIETAPFLLLASFLGSFFFLLIFNKKPLFWEALVSSFLTIVFYRIMKTTKKESI